MAPRNLVKFNDVYMYETLDRNINEVETCSTKIGNVSMTTPSTDDDKEEFLKRLQLTLNLVHFYASCKRWVRIKSAFFMTYRVSHYRPDNLHRDLILGLWYVDWPFILTLNKSKAGNTNIKLCLTNVSSIAVNARLSICWRCSNKICIDKRPAF